MSPLFGHHQLETDGGVFSNSTDTITLGFRSLLKYIFYVSTFGHHQLETDGGVFFNSTDSITLGFRSLLKYIFYVSTFWASSAMIFSC